MNGRRDDDRSRRTGDEELRRGERVDYQAGRRGEYGRDWDEHGDQRGPERRAWSGRDERDREEGRRAWGDDRDYEHLSRNFDRDRDSSALEGDRERRDYERDLDYARAARDLDRAREPGRDFDRDRELDRRSREFDPERIARRPGYSPSGTFREVPDEGYDERERLRRYDMGGGRDIQRRGGPPDRGGPARGRPDVGGRGTDDRRGQYTRRGGARDLGPTLTERIAETDIRYGGTQPAGHGPGVENMAPPLVGFSTSPSRREDHDLGHGGFIGGGYGTGTPARTGRGPRNYQRGDDRIRADLCDRLMQSWIDAEDVDVQVKDGVVTLSGSVRGRDEKRAIEDLAEEVLGAKEVINVIRIYRAEGVMRQASQREPVRPPGVDTAEDDALHS